MQWSVFNIYRMWFHNFSIGTIFFSYQHVRTCSVLLDCTAVQRSTYLTQIALNFVAFLENLNFKPFWSIWCLQYIACGFTIFYLSGLAPFFSPHIDVFFQDFVRYDFLHLKKNKMRRLSNLWFVYISCKSNFIIFIPDKILPKCSFVHRSTYLTQRT